MYLKEIKKILGFDIIGNAEEQVKGITFACCAEDDDIAIIDVQGQATTTKAKVLLVNRMLLGTGKTVVLCNCPWSGTTLRRWASCWPRRATRATTGRALRLAAWSRSRARCTIWVRRPRARRC